MVKICIVNVLPIHLIENCVAVKKKMFAMRTLQFLCFKNIFGVQIKN